MASYLEISNISKSYGPKVLFENIGFNINEGDKIALIAPNGTGKTSLMKILAGKDKSDSGGRIMFLRDVRIAFLEQEYDFDPEKEIFRQVMDGSRQYTEGLDLEHLWEYERRVKEFLTDFKLGDGSRKMKELSGGEVKRVALTQMLASEADFFIMDEPTNHLDIDAIEYLESFLSRSRCTLFMVTHDRYFLDRVCNTVMEMERGNIYIYKGNYQNFLEKREERIANWNAETDKVRNILRRELEWIHATPCARTGKAKYRIDAFHELKERAGQSIQSRQLDLGDMSDRGARRLGTKIIDCTDLSFHYDGNCYLDHFSYKFQRGEKVGIVGANGAGKTTFINLLLEGNRWGGEMSGSIERGESLKIGYYRQEGMVFDEDQTVLETVNDSYLLGRFLFPHDMYNSLVLDEPTNDLDIVTLNVLEEYLKEFKGSLIIVSHDRHFLDRLVDHLFVFCGNGVVKDFIGNYSEYRSFIKDYRKEQAAAAKELSVRGEGKTKTEKVRRLSWKEQREMESLEAEIEALNAEKASLEESLSSGTLGTEELMKASERIGEVIKLCDEKEMRWLELSEIGQ